jgi:hypothetical protein
MADELEPKKKTQPRMTKHGEVASQNKIATESHDAAQPQPPILYPQIARIYADEKSAQSANPADENFAKKARCCRFSFLHFRHEQDRRFGREFA